MFLKYLRSVIFGFQNPGWVYHISCRWEGSKLWKGWLQSSQGWWWPQTMILVPSGYVKIAIEHCHRNSEFSYWKWWFSMVMLNYQRVSNGCSHQEWQISAFRVAYENPQFDVSKLYGRTGYISGRPMKWCLIITSRWFLQWTNGHVQNWKIMCCVASKMDKVPSSTSNQTRQWTIPHL